MAVRGSSIDELHAGHVRHADVGEHRLRRLRRLPVQGFGAARRLQHAIAKPRQKAVEGLTNAVFVVHHEHRRRRLLWSGGRHAR
jgi:hypothetical protein